MTTCKVFSLCKYTRKYREPWLLRCALGSWVFEPGERVFAPFTSFSPFVFPSLFLKLPQGVWSQGTRLWPVSHSRMPLRSIHVVPNGRASFQSVFLKIYSFERISSRLHAQHGAQTVLDPGTPRSRPELKPSVGCSSSEAVQRPLSIFIADSFSGGVCVCTCVCTCVCPIFFTHLPRTHKSFLCLGSCK